MRDGLEALKKNQSRGLSLPFVACAGAFLLAFALVLVYTAGLMLSNANHKLSEERCYQLAKSFSEVVGEELEKQEQPGSFCEFANKFLNNPAYNEYQPDRPETEYHYSLQIPADENYGDIDLRLRKELNEGDLGGLEGEIDPPTTDEQNYTERIEVLKQTKFQRYIFTVEIIARQEGLTYNYATEYYREDQYPVIFRYNEQVIVWDTDNNAWKYGNSQGPTCVFGTEGEKITYTYDTSRPINAKFIPVHQEGGGA